MVTEDPASLFLEQQCALLPVRPGGKRTVRGPHRLAWSARQLGGRLRSMGWEAV